MALDLIADACIRPEKLTRKNYIDITWRQIYIDQRLCFAMQNV